MATHVQTKIFTELEDNSLQPVKGGSFLRLNGPVGRLAIGKLGDVVESAYSPVVKAHGIESVEEIEMGTYVKGWGILVNSNDCAGVGNYDTMMDTKSLKKGQTGSFLESGACVVKCTTATELKKKMWVSYVSEITSGTDDVCVVEVNGCKEVQTPTKEEVKEAIKDIPAATATFNDIVSALVSAGLIEPGTATFNALNDAVDAPSTVTTPNGFLTYFRS